MHDKKKSNSKQVWNWEMFMDVAGVSDGVWPESGCSPCQMSVLLASRGWGPQWPDLILDKVPIEPCPRHGLPLAQTILSVPLPLSVWPVSPRMSRHLPASKHSGPSQLFCLHSAQHCVTVQAGPRFMKGFWKRLNNAREFSPTLSVKS